MGTDYDSVAVLYDTYVTADFDVPYLVSQVRRPNRGGVSI